MGTIWRRLLTQLPNSVSIHGYTRQSAFHTHKCCVPTENTTLTPLTLCRRRSRSWTRLRRCRPGWRRSSAPWPRSSPPSSSVSRSWGTAQSTHSPMVSLFTVTTKIQYDVPTIHYTMVNGWKQIHDVLFIGNKYLGWIDACSLRYCNFKCVNYLKQGTRKHGWNSFMFLSNSVEQREAAMARNKGGPSWAWGR